MGVSPRVPLAIQEHVLVVCSFGKRFEALDIPLQILTGIFPQDPLRMLPEVPQRILTEVIQEIPPKPSSGIHRKVHTGIDVENLLDLFKQFL